MLDWYAHLSVKAHVLVFFGVIWFNGLCMGAFFVTCYFTPRFKRLRRQFNDLDARIKEAYEVGTKIREEQTALRKAIGFASADDATSDVWGDTP